ERILHRGGAGGLAADHAHRRRQRLERHGDAADEPAAADGDDDRVELAELLAELERDGALPGDDLGILERMHQERAAVARVLLGDGPGVVPVAAMALDARA